MLETTSQAVVSAILERQQSLGLPEGGGQVKLSIPVSGSPQRSELSLLLDLPPTRRAVNLPTLQRLRRTFVRMHSSSMASTNVVGDAARDESRADGSAGEADVAKRFAGWLCESLRSQ